MINIAKGNEFIKEWTYQPMQTLQNSPVIIKGLYSSKNVFTSVFIREYFYAVLRGASVVKFKIQIQFIAQNKPTIGNLFFE